MTVRAVVFDLFKTLGELQRAITDEEAASLLKTITDEEAASLLKTEDTRYIRRRGGTRSASSCSWTTPDGFDSHEALIKQVFRRLGVDVDEDTVHDLADVFRSSPFRLYPRSIEAVKRVHSMGLKTAIATSTPNPFFKTGVEPIAEYIDLVCTGYEASYEKSNPAHTMSSRTGCGSSRTRRS